MKFCHLIRNLVRHRFDFHVGWFDWLDDGTWSVEGSEFYCISIVLGNREYIVPHDNEAKLGEIWEEIKTYWLN